MQNGVTKNSIIEWRCLGKSVTGATHTRLGKQNQDSLAIPSDPDQAFPIIIALSDGLGSAKSFRSHDGSRLAVETAVQVLQRFSGHHNPESNLSDYIRTAEETLPRHLVGAWRQAAEQHITNNQFTELELEKLGVAAAPARQQAENDPALAYAATLLAVVVTQKSVLYIQLGDGDILAVSDTGEVQRPLPSDPRLFANETTSLVTTNVLKDFRVRVSRPADPWPALILLATDGYSNSFADDSTFMQVGSDYLDLLRNSGVSSVEARLEGWLNETSQKGSGDDITVGILFRHRTTHMVGGSAELPSCMPDSEHLSSDATAAPSSAASSGHTPDPASDGRITTPLTH